MSEICGPPFIND